MSARAHPRLVGAFVLGAVALLLGTVLLLSSGDWFERRERFSLYFPGASVRGLHKGAAVTFRGIKIGEVAEVAALATGRSSPAVQIEVVAELKGEVVKAPPGVALPFVGYSGEAFARELTARGFRGRLMSQSLLTGQKYVDFEILPDEPPRISGIRPRYPELPTTPTAMEKLGDKAGELMNKLADLPVDQMLDDLQKTLASARSLLDSPDLRGALAGARRTTERLPETVEDVRSAVADARRLMETLDGETRTTAADVRETVRAARDSLDRVERTMAALDTAIEGSDDARIRASETLQELDRTLKAVRNLVDYIQTHPEAVVLGKPKEGANK
jgi:paraquat-inducible protein B